MHLFITCIRTMIVPLTSSNMVIRREIEANTTLVMNRMEERVNSIVQKTIDVALAWVSKLLATQKKNDFRPRDEGPNASSHWLETLQTPVRSSPSLNPWNAQTNRSIDLFIDIYVLGALSFPRQNDPRFFFQSYHLSDRDCCRHPHRAV